jgi:hypothetical protein
MGAAEMTERIAETSPRFKARMAGFFYLLMFPVGGLAVFARRGLVVNGDAAATAINHCCQPPPRPLYNWTSDNNSLRLV